MSQGFGTPPQTAQSGSGLYIQETQPDSPTTPALWIPIDSDGHPADVSEWQVFTDSAPAAPNFTVTPAVTGTALVGSTLTCDGGTVTGSPTPAKTYQWKRDGVNRSGETATTYVLVSGDVGHAITCAVTATNTGGTDSDTSNSVTPAIPANSVAPAVTGSAVTGQTLTASTGTWSGSPTYTYQWKRAGSAISGATSSTYVLQVADEGVAVKCTVTATNANGSASADSNSVTPSASATAPGAPTGLSLTPGDTTIAATWTAPASNGGSAITTYLVEYRTPNGSGSYTTFTHSASTTPSITITGLTNASAYGVRVSAVNAIGTGSATSEAVATPASAGFDATAHGTVLAHWIGDDAPGSDGAAMATWTDASAAGRDMTQSTSGSRPLKKTNILNGHAVARFDGTDDLMTYTRMATIRSVFIVAKKTGAYDKEGPILGDATTYDFIGPSSIGLINPGFAAADLLNGEGYRDGVSTAPNLIECPSTEFHLYELIPAGNLHSDQLGQDRNLAGTGSWRGDFAEILIYSTALGTTDRQAVETYLMTKYGL